MHICIYAYNIIYIERVVTVGTSMPAASPTPPSSTRPTTHTLTHTHTRARARAHARTHARTHAHTHTHTHSIPYLALEHPAFAGAGAAGPPPPPDFFRGAADLLSMPCAPGEEFGPVDAEQREPGPGYFD